MEVQIRRVSAIYMLTFLTLSFILAFFLFIFLKIRPVDPHNNTRILVPFDHKQRMNVTPEIIYVQTRVGNVLNGFSSKTVKYKKANKKKKKASKQVNNNKLQSSVSIQVLRMRKNEKTIELLRLKRKANAEKGVLLRLQSQDLALDPLGRYGVESHVVSYRRTWARAQKRHEFLFNHIIAGNGISGLEDSCDSSHEGGKHTERTVHVAIGVLSGAQPVYKTRREAWRKVWNKWPVKIRAHTVMRFFVGLPTEKRHLRALEEESTIYKDMMILGHNDCYTNITLKSISVFAWGAEACGAYYTIKTDDDTFIHLPRLLANLYSMHPTNVYAGAQTHSKTYNPIRDKNHMWYVSKWEYPFSQGPAYVRGCIVVMSWDLAYHVGRVRSIPNFHWLAIEDVTLGYIVASKRPTYVMLPLTVLRGQCKNNAVAIHYVPEDKLIHLLENVLSDKPLCTGYP